MNYSVDLTSGALINIGEIGYVNEEKKLEFSLAAERLGVRTPGVKLRSPRVERAIVRS